MKRLLIGTNHKMYKTISQSEQYLKKLQSNIADLPKEIVVFVIPSFTSLQNAVQTVKKGAILLGAQNMHDADEGQFTGEISPLMLKELGLDIIEIGHSERRHVFGETDEQENKKVLSSLKHGFIPLLCIGETKEEKDDHISDEMLRIQIKRGLKGVSPKDAAKLWVAYEPVWAIGVNGTPASPEYASEKHLVIKAALNEMFPGIDIPVLYGGSVNLENASELIVQDGIDGLFVGRAAWDADNFDKLIRMVWPLWQKKNNA